MLQWIFLNWSGVLAVALTFGFMIFVHELGHFLMAKRAGMTVHEFALGFGPRLISFGGNKKKKNKDDNEADGTKPQENDKKYELVKTEYCLRAIPLGGFVSLEGEDDAGNMDDPGNFNNKNVYERLSVILAGCVMNYVTGILLLIMIGFLWGIPSIDMKNPPAVVGNLVPGYPLQKAGIKRGDKITQINGTKVSGFNQLSKIISPLKEGEKVEMTVLRKDKPIKFTVTVKYNKERQRGMLGFSPKVSILNLKFDKPSSAGAVVGYSFSTAFKLTIMPVRIVQMIASKQLSGKEVVKGTAGPVGISQMLFEVSKKGIPSLLYICAFLSILIGAFNLLPVPALDGARALFMVIEIIRGKPVDPEKEGQIHQWGFAILLLMVFLVTINDVLRLVRGENLFK